MSFNALFSKLKATLVTLSSRGKKAQTYDPTIPLEKLYEQRFEQIGEDLKRWQNTEI